MARVFLSHANADKPMVRRIRDALREVGHHPWFDDDDILVGDSIPAKIEEGLREADYVVVCLSSAALTDHWVETERNVSLMAHRSDETPPRVLPVRLEAVPPPASLAHVKSVDLFPEHQFDDGIVELLDAMSTHAELEAASVTGLIHASDVLGGHDVDQPRFSDVRNEALSDALRDAYRRKRRLEQAGAPTAGVVTEILRLKREIRRGGQLRAGDALGEGRYLLLKQIGRGGFGTVWEALDERYRDHVAIKVLHSELRGDPVRRDRFFRGARNMAKLAHEAIVRVRDPGAEDDGFCFFVMELVTGGDLREAVLKRDFTPSQIMRLAVSVGDAIAFAHRRGLIHRDVNPANVLLTEQERARLTDFDLVATQETTGGTRTGALGTFLYAAPEMLDRPQDVDQRVDVYSLGMTVAFMLHGHALPSTVMRDAPGFIGKLRCRSAIKRVLQRAVSWEPDERFADAGGFVRALRDAIAAPDRPAGAAADGDRTRRQRETHPIHERKRLAEQRRERPRPSTLRGLLRELRKGYTLYRPILIPRDAKAKSNHVIDSIDRTVLRRPPAWAEQYGRTYAGHPFVVLEPAKHAAGVESPVTIGRSRRCDVRIESDSVSKVHASVVFDLSTGEYYVVDELSRNGTFINGCRIEPRTRAKIWSGAYLGLGGTVFVFVDPPTLRKLATLVA